MQYARTQAFVCLSTCIQRLDFIEWRSYLDHCLERARHLFWLFDVTYWGFLREALQGTLAELHALVISPNMSKSTVREIIEDTTKTYKSGLGPEILADFSEVVAIGLVAVTVGQVIAQPLDYYMAHNFTELSPRSSIVLLPKRKPLPILINKRIARAVDYDLVAPLAPCVERDANLTGGNLVFSGVLSIVGITAVRPIVQDSAAAVDVMTDSDRFDLCGGRRLFGGLSRHRTDECPTSGCNQNSHCPLPRLILCLVKILAEGKCGQRNTESTPIRQRRYVHF